LLSNFNFSSFRLPVDNPAIIDSKNALSNSKNCVRFARMNPFDPMLVVKASAILAAADIFTNEELIVPAKSL
jgi:hypothetical protein